MPTIVALRDKVEDIRRKELERITDRLKTLSPDDRETVEGLTNTIVNKILHGHLVALKSEANSSNGLLYAETIRKIFNLEIKVADEDGEE